MEVDLTRDEWAQAYSLLVSILQYHSKGLDVNKVLLPRDIPILRKLLGMAALKKD